MLIVNKTLSVGRNESITCVSIISVDLIEWLNSDGETVFSQSNTNMLKLTFTPVNTSINNKQYTCRANKNGFVNKTVTLTVSGKVYIKVNFMPIKHLFNMFLHKFAAQADALVIEFEVPNHIPSIGEMITINCSVEIIQGVIDLPLLILKHPNGTNISTAQERKLSLSSKSVEATDAGEYICTAEIVISDLHNLSLFVQSKESVTLKCRF